MKQRLFKNCTCETARFQCANCPNYLRCLEHKVCLQGSVIEKARKKEQENVAALRFFAIIAAILFITLLVVSTCWVIREIRRPDIIVVDGPTTPVETTSPEVPEAPENPKTEASEDDPILIPVAELSAYGPSESYYYNLSEEDKITIAKVVWAEARGECYEGKVAVAAVVLNRYFKGDSQFDKTSIYSVATQKGAFASIAGVTEEDLEEVPSCMQAVEDACKGWDPTLKVFPNGAFFFYNPAGVKGYQAEIREGIKIMAIEHHNFHADFEKMTT